MDAGGAGVILQDDGQGRRVGNRLDVIEDASFRVYGLAVRRQHHRVRALVHRRFDERSGGAGAAMACADDDRDAALGGLDGSGDDLGAFAVRQTVRFAEHAEDSHAIHSKRGHPLDHVHDARDVDGLVGQERCGQDGEDAAEVWHRCSF